MLTTIFDLIAFVYFYVALCIVCGMGAKARGRDLAGYLLVSIFLTPLVVYAYLLLVPPKEGLS
jgi:hypothetical protein